MEINLIPLRNINILATSSTTEAQSTAEVKDSQSEPSQRRNLLNTNGVPRIALAFLSLGITEVVRLVQSYQTTRNTSPEPKLKNEYNPNLFKNKTEQHNAKLIKAVFEGNQNTPDPSTLDIALEKVKSELERSNIDKDPHDPAIINRAYQQLWVAPNKQQKFTKEILTELISKEMKSILIKQQLVEEIQKELDKRAIEHDAGTIAVLLQRKAGSLTALSTYSNESLSKELMALVEETSNIAESMRNYGKAKEEIKKLYLKSVMQKKGLNNEESMQDEGVLKLLSAINQKADQHEAREIMRNKGKMPPIPINAYRYLFTQVAKPFFEELREK